MSEQTAPAMGRRDRKKARTREALRGAARRLFAEQGFGATTVEQIADAADVSERTFFRYFESKEDLLLPDLAALFATVEDELADRPLAEHPLEAYLAALTAAVVVQPAGGMPDTAASADLDNPLVAARLVKAFLAWEERLTELFTDRLRQADPSLDPDAAALRATVTASVAVGATRAAMRLIRAGSMAPAERLAVLRAAFAVARTGCTADAASGAAPAF